LAEVLSIDELRERIDVIDNQLVRLLNVREARVLAKVKQSALDLSGPLTAEAVVRIFERIIDEARRAERESGSTRDDFGPSIGE
jgi:chorismate mutase